MSWGLEDWNFIKKYFCKWCFPLWFYSVIKNRQKEKRRWYFSEKKTTKKKQNNVIIISLDEEGNVFPVKLKLEGKLFE